MYRGIRLFKGGTRYMNRTGGILETWDCRSLGMGAVCNEFC